MSKQKTLKNPPIREALIDIRVNSPENYDVKSLEDYFGSINKEYPIKQLHNKIETRFEVQQYQQTTFTKGSHNGYIFKTQMPNKIIQFRKDGFTFNKLKPYTTWEDFSNEAKKHWENYLKITKARLVTRIALRYINVLEIPLPLHDLNEYLLTVPNIAPGIPQGLSEFFMRLVIPDEKTKNVAIITETIDIEQQKKIPSLFPLIFDIDVFYKINMQAETSLIWKSFESIRQYKNRIFFESITDKMIKLLDR